MNRTMIATVLRSCFHVMFGVLLVVLIAGSGFSADTYTDLKGRFVIDLPDGFNLASS